MNKTTKGALAAAAAAALLLGGFGTHATWTANDDIDGTDITAGHLKLASAQCDGWKLLSRVIGDLSWQQVDLADLLVVPGDVLKQHCTFTVDAAGAHIAADLSVDPSSWGAGSNSNLVDNLDVNAVYKLGATTVTDPTSVKLKDGDTLSADITVTFDQGAGDLTQDVSALLNDITVTATQAAS